MGLAASRLLQPEAPSLKRGFEGATLDLQEYNMTKRLEHSYKSIFSDGKAISAVDPKYYSRRFQECMQKVFV